MQQILRGVAPLNGRMPGVSKSAVGDGAKRNKKPAKDSPSHDGVT
jgi:hypothetical protein